MRHGTVVRAAIAWAAAVMCVQAGAAEAMPPPVEECAVEPVKYVGTAQPDRAFYDGRLPHAVGVHRYQAFRANRSAAQEDGLFGWTYNHQPYLAYWNNRFYFQYLSTPVGEHMAPGRTLLMTSPDAREWSKPEIVFPIYPLPEMEHEGSHVPAGMGAVMHQRMGFYVAPNGRLLTLGFYGICATPRQVPNNGQGIGRVVREIYRDGSLGPLYFIRYNRHAGWNEGNTLYPFYKTSDDAGFVEACEALLADKLMTIQWWEEDRADDGFYTIDTSKVAPGSTSRLAPRAGIFFHRHDGAVVGIWKHQWAALSADEGHTWTDMARCETLLTCGAKVWGQRTPDGRYALVYNHSVTRRNRFPMVVMTGEDGHAFDNMLVLEGEVSPMRFYGQYKNLGTQYIRGIEEGNGTPPGGYLWNVWSMNKEDLWVCRTRVPVTGRVEDQVSEDFDSLGTEADLEQWNLYSPQWAPVRLAEIEDGKCLEMRDEDPYDYALIERIFPVSTNGTVSFRINVSNAGHGVPEVELHDRAGRRALRLRFEREWLVLDIKDLSTDKKVLPPPIRFEPERWYDIALSFDCAARSYDLTIDGKTIGKGITLAEEVDSLERFVVRTGSWRGDVRGLFVDGEPGSTGMAQEDLPGADTKVPLTRVLLDNVRTVAQ